LLENERRSFRSSQRRYRYKPDKYVDKTERLGRLMSEDFSYILRTSNWKTDTYFDVLGTFYVATVMILANSRRSNVEDVGCTT